MTETKKMSVYEKLAEVQKKVSVPKDQYNDFGKYHFRNLESINKAVKEQCEECGYWFTDEPVYIEGRFYVKSTVTFWASCDPENHIEVSAYAREAQNKKGSDEAQITGLASSYARKYAACALFDIDEGKDIDAMDNEARKAKKNDRLKPVREKYKEYKEATGESNESAIPKICKAANAKDMKSMNEAQAHSAVEYMQVCIEAAYRRQEELKKQDTEEDIYDEDVEF